MATVARNGRTAPRPGFAAWMLCQRELVRFFRQRNRVIGAVGQPIIFWLLFGVGLDQSFQLSETGRAAEQSFQQYYVPGTIALIVLFTAIFTTISIIEDRQEGFLQSVLVAPLPRWSMVAGKILGGTLIALIQAVLFLLLVLAVERRFDVGQTVQLVAMLGAAAFGLTGLGFVLAWRMDSTQGFHAVMSVLLFPMWLLSGAFFPLPLLSEADSWLRVAMFWVMRANPLTYAVAGVRRLMSGAEVGDALHLPSLATCWIVTIGFGLLMFAMATYMTRYRTKGDLR